MVKLNLPTNHRTFSCGVLRKCTIEFLNRVPEILGLQFDLLSQQQPTREMEDLEKLSLKIDSCLPKLGTAELILTLTQLGINIEGKPGILSNKRKLIIWLQNSYDDLIGDTDNGPEKRKATLQGLLFFVEKFEGHDYGEGHDTNSREQQENTARTNQPWSYTNKNQP